MKDYTNLLPLLPPEGILTWAQSKGKLNGHIIAYEKVWLTDPITERKYAACKCRCSACCEEFYLEYRAGGTHGYPKNTYGCYNYKTNETFGDWSSILCPECGVPVRTLRLASIRGYHCAGCLNPITIHVIDQEKLAIIEWDIERKIYRDMRIETEYHRSEAYILDKKKLIRFKGFEDRCYVSFWLDHWKQCRRGEDCSGGFDLSSIYGFDMEQLKGTLWENCKLDRYLKVAKGGSLVLYLRSFAQYPNIENIVMSSGAYLLKSIYKKHCRGRALNPAPRTVTEIDYKVARPPHMLGLNKDEFRYFTENNVEWSEIEFYKAHRGEIKPEDVLELKKLDNYQSLISDDYPCNIMSAARYLLSQREKRRDYYTTSVGYLHDYWRMLFQVDGAITPDNRYPQNLERAHEAVTRRIEQAKKNERNERYIKRREQLSRFAWESNGLIIRAVADDDELYEEGKILHHCVYSYADSHCSGKTAIMVIRHADKPSEPYFTLELGEKNLTVRQNRGMCNCARTAEVVAFEKEWLDHIKKIKELEDNGKRSSRKERIRTGA